MDHMTKITSSTTSSSLHSLSNKLILVNEETKKSSILIRSIKRVFNLNLLQTFSSPPPPHTITRADLLFSKNSHLLVAGTTTTSTYFETNSKNIALTIDLATLRKLNDNHNPRVNQEKYLNFLNFYYQINYHQNIVYYNNLLLALIILFVLFSLLILLEENETFYNLSAITFLLLITFNLIILIFSHNLAKQFLVHKHFA
jgi:hypothetical protein